LNLHYKDWSITR